MNTKKIKAKMKLNKTTFNLKSNSKAQVSFEYLLILGIAIFLLVPIFGIFYSSSIDAQVSSSSKQITLAGAEIVSTAEKVVYQGANSRIKLSLDFPGNIKNISIRDNNNTLVMLADMNGISTEFVFFSSVKLNFNGCKGTETGNLTSEGKKEIYVESCGKNATIYTIE